MNVYKLNLIFSGLVLLIITLLNIESATGQDTFEFLIPIGPVALIILIFSSTISLLICIIKSIIYRTNIKELTISLIVFIPIIFITYKIVSAVLGIDQSSLNSGY